MSSERDVSDALDCSMCRHADFDGGDDGPSGAICWRGGGASVMPPVRCAHYEMDASFKDTVYADRSHP